MWEELDAAKEVADEARGELEMLRENFDEQNESLELNQEEIQTCN